METYDPKLICYEQYENYTGGKMHNLISYNNLKAWTSLEEETTGTDPVTEYFECITDCAIDDRSCIRECRLVLDQEES